MSSSVEELAVMKKVYGFEYLIVSEICQATAVSKVCDGPLYLPIYIVIGNGALDTKHSKPTAASSRILLSFTYREKLSLGAGGEPRGGKHQKRNE